MPKVTVLLCVHNDAAFVGEAVRSILVQTFADFELLVIDDGSTDQSADIVRAFADPRIRLLRNESNVGLTRSLNIGLAAARGDLVARQDSDDVSLPERLEKQVEAFHSIPDLALLGSQARVIDEHGKKVRASGWRKCTTRLAIEWQMMFENAFVHSSVMFRRDLVVAGLGGYDERWRTNQDFELWSRVTARHTTANLDSDLVTLRTRSSSISKSYSLSAIQAVGDRLVEVRSHSLRRQCQWDEGVRILLAVFNPATCSPVRNIQPLEASVAEMLRRFVEIHPEAAGSLEIRTHIASLFARMAILLAGWSPAAAVRAFRAAQPFDRSAAWRTAPGIAARMVYGLIRPRRREAQEELLVPKKEE